MASMAQETLHLILQNKFDRIENLVQINNQTTLAIPTILIAIWGVEGGIDNFRNALILSIISIGLVLIWRYFAHYIDNDIANTYIDVIRTENRLGVQDDLSFFDNFIDPLTKNQKIKQLKDDNRVNFFKCLNDEKKMGYRGHKEWDRVALLLIGLCVVVSISAIFHPLFFRIVHKLPPHFHWIDNLLIEIAFFGIVFLFGLVITCVIWKIFKAITPIQRNPTEPEIQLYYDKITTPKKDISD
jgi:hypothetical protein